MQRRKYQYTSHHSALGQRILRKAMTHIVTLPRKDHRPGPLWHKSRLHVWVLLALTVLSCLFRPKNSCYQHLMERKLPKQLPATSQFPRGVQRHTRMLSTPLQGNQQRPKPRGNSSSFLLQMSPGKSRSQLCSLHPSPALLC